MVRLLLAAATWLWAALAFAAPLEVDVAVLQTPCGFPGSALNLNFQTNSAQLFCQNAGLATGQLSITRATTGMAQYQSGIWQSFPSGAFRITDKGLLVEEARTNDALWSRDMTNAAWIKVNMTTALTATGIDGNANSASQLTATAGNGTVLQTITLGSTADTYDVFLQRVSGTGNVQITVDNGGTWTTQSVTTSWTQFQIQKTAANPIFGIRLVTSGDVINADFNQLEPGGFATSPILTTTTVATRNADVVTLGPVAQSNALAAASAYFQTSGSNGGTAPRLFNFGSSINVLMDYASTTSAQINDNTNTSTATIGGGVSISGVVKVAFGMDNTSMTVVANGGTKNTQATSVWATNVVGQTPVYLANRAAGDRALNGYLQRMALSKYKGLFDTVTSP